MTASNGKKTCDKCGKVNTEFMTVEGTYDVSKLKTKITIGKNSYIKRVIHRYLSKFLRGTVKVDTDICQSCVSKGFRSFRKDY